MGEVRHTAEPGLQLGFEVAKRLFALGDVGLQALALGDAFRFLRGGVLFARSLCRLVLKAPDGLNGVEQSLALAFDLDHSLEVVKNVLGDIAVPAVLPDRVSVGEHIFHIEHAENPYLGSFASSANRWAL